MADTNKNTGNQDKRVMRQTQTAVAHRIVFWVIGIIVTLLVVVGFMAFRYVKSSFEPVNANATETVSVKIPIGSTSKDIAEILTDKKIIKSAMVFDYYVKSNNYTDFQAGTYTFKQSMNLREVIGALRTDGVDVAKPVAHLLVREGVTIETIAGTMHKYTKKDSNLTKKNFMKVMKDAAFFKRMVAKYPDLLGSAAKAKKVRYRLEGYLFPATYDVAKNMTAEKLVESMLETTNTTLAPYYKSIKKNGLTVQQALSLASIVEREGVTNASRKKIAGVILNRLDVKMPIQSDITVMYALNTHKTSLTNKDVQVDSPYNLYVHTGYGPGPVNQPSLQSITAVLNPTDRSAGYLYFVANLKTGEILYAKTLAEHNVNIAKFASDNNN